MYFKTIAAFPKIKLVNLLVIPTLAASIQILLGGPAVRAVYVWNVRGVCVARVARQKYVQIWEGRPAHYHSASGCGGH